MSCENNACGTGGWSGPKPGDPDNNVLLSANAVFGGIEVYWTYPTTNPHAVAHTLLYRGLSNDFSLAMQRAVVAGSIFQDRLNPVTAIQYYYWIQVVSVNGTVGELRGPVSAIARPMAEDTLESLTGRIDAGVLANALKGEISRITLLDGDIIGEIQNRLASHQALSAAFAEIQASVDEAVTFVGQEIIQRTEGDSALVDAINVLFVQFNDNVAVLLEEQTLLAEADAALGNTISTLAVTLANNLAAAVQVEATARVNADGALSNQIATSQSTLNNNLASAQTTLQTNINTVNGKVTGIGALYTTKITVNGLVGGFGVYNNGTEVQAGFDVDTFWVGRTGPDKVKPFIISGGTVYIDKARIRNADIDTLKISGNAVTVPLYLSGYGGASNVTGNTEFEVASIWGTYADMANVVAMINWQASAPGASGNTVGVIKVDGVTFGEWANSGTNYNVSSHSMSAKAYIGAGSHRFSFHVKNGWPSGSWNLQSWSVMLLGVMR